LFFSPFSVSAIDLYTVSADTPEISMPTMTTSAGHVIPLLTIYPNTGTALIDSPVYDAASDSYHIPAAVTTTVMVPESSAVASGDATLHPVTVGQTAIVAVPGTDIMQLADGTYTNAVPSSTLSNALAGLGSGIPIPTAADLTATLPVGTVLSVPYAGQLGESPTSPHKIKITGSWSSIPVNSSSQLGSGFYFDNTYCIIYVFLGMSGTTYTYKKMFASRTDASLLPETDFPDNATSAGLADALAVDQPSFASNGLAQDYLSACAASQNCTVVQGDMTDTDINTWITNNDDAVAGAVASSIAAGASASAMDGTNTGAQQQTTGQLAGIQSAINRGNDKLDDIKDELEKPYDPASVPAGNTYDSTVAQPEELSLADTISSFVATGLPFSQSFAASRFDISAASPVIDDQLCIPIPGSVPICKDLQIDFSFAETYLDWAGAFLYAMTIITVLMALIF